jgi:formylglycine-generating enzyme required for sulfatase activity
VKVERLQRGLREGLVLLLGDTEHALPFTERVRAGFLLGQLGDDPRLLDPTTGNSPIGDYWCHIEAGTFWFWDNREEELHQIKLPYDFSIGRYPVTNAEYARFIEAGGYQDEQWWTKQGWQFRQPGGHRYDRISNEQAITLPRFWTDLRYNNPIQPVATISWYEANAYAIWLTSLGHAQGWLSPNEVIRLPTSLEWERAARHTDQRRYSWGDEPATAEYANAEESDIGKPSPIGCFPRGATVCGAQDMLGNVWEWTATLHEQDEELQPRDDFSPIDEVRLRGGSWGNKSAHLHCGVRDQDVADFWIGSLGLRLVRSRSGSN